VAALDVPAEYANVEAQSSAGLATKSRKTIWQAHLLERVSCFRGVYFVSRFAFVRLALPAY
jgi:hypothetical protein